MSSLRWFGKSQVRSLSIARFLQSNLPARIPLGIAPSPECECEGDDDDNDAASYAGPGPRWGLVMEGETEDGIKGRKQKPGQEDVQAHRDEIDPLLLPGGKDRRRLLALDDG